MNSLTQDSTNTINIAEPVGILGVGVEGRATIDYLLARGVRRIEALDLTPQDGLPDSVTAVFGAGHSENLERFATIFKSPGIRPDIPALERAKAAGTVVTSALSHFMERCPAPVLGITGTVGKGTASSLLAEALTSAGYRVHLGGNIGTSPLTFLQSIVPTDRVVLEISSFQAMDISRSPSIAAILKTTTEHLDWHTSTEEYRLAKAHLLFSQTENDVVVYCADAAGSLEIANRSAAKKLGFSLEKEVAEGIFLRGDHLILRLNGVESVLPLSVSGCAIAGRFNLENIAAAVLMAILSGADPSSVCGAVAAFKGLPHRLERCASSGGIRFFNDSYATRPEATLAAVGAFHEPIALILGGSEKNADFTELVQALRLNSYLRGIVLIGATAARLHDALCEGGPPSFPLLRAETLDDAMRIGVGLLENTGVLLMSPACASFGLFKNYKDRGEKFRAIAARIAKGDGK